MTTLKSLVAGAVLALTLGLSPAESAGLAAGKVVVAAPPTAIEAQYSYNSRAFRRCMRAKYGPRYFSRVNRAHRWHMSQACMS